MVRLPKNAFDTWSMVLFSGGAIHSGIALLGFVMNIEPRFDRSYADPATANAVEFIASTFHVGIRPADWFLAGILCVIGSRLHDIRELLAMDFTRQSVPPAAPPPPKARMT